MRFFIVVSWCCAALIPGVLEAKSVKQAREEVVDETVLYLNVPYLWGGRHPKTGLDCSSFVQVVYAKAGLHLPRVSRAQFSATHNLKPSDVLPGDLVFFAMKNPGTAKVDHVGIYMGKGYFIHASVTHGVHIESIDKPYYLNRLVGVRKYRGF
ncbi:MAG: C40 family peptidase [Elusimicrobia bacterium]|nr:C40 family peptidase [Elusimicrobiota bacterium]